MKHYCWILAAFLGLASVVGAKPDRPSLEPKKIVPNMVTRETQKAIDGGLAYLAKEQHADGSWGTGTYHGNVAVTSLAGLAFLSGNHQPDQGDHGKAVTKALRFILGSESEDTPGFFNNPKSAFHGPMYGHGFTVLFLADAHGTITDKKLKKEVKEALERATKLTVASQNQAGGWRYHPRPNDGDLSVTAVQIVALRAARDAGFAVPKETFDKAIKYVKSCRDQNTGGFRYQEFGGTPGFARTAAGLTSLNRLGVKADADFEKGLNYLRKFDREEGFGNFKMHYHYGNFYAAKAMWYAGDKEWQKWYPTIRTELLEEQKDDHWTQGLMCPHYCTAMALIILQMPHGHLQSLKR